MIVDPTLSAQGLRSPTDDLLFENDPSTAATNPSRIIYMLNYNDEDLPGRILPLPSGAYCSQYRAKKDARRWVDDTVRSFSVVHLDRRVLPRETGVATFSNDWKRSGWEDKGDGRISYTISDLYRGFALTVFVEEVELDEGEDEEGYKTASTAWDTEDESEGVNEEEANEEEDGEDPEGEYLGGYDRGGCSEDEDEDGDNGQDQDQGENENEEAEA